MDYGVRAISEKHHFKIYLLDLTSSLQEIVGLQKTNPFATILLAKATLANSLLALSLKNGEVLTTTIDSPEAKTGKIIAEFQNNKVRSYIENPQFMIDEKEANKANNPYEWAWGKNGTLTIKRQLKGFDPYISKVSLSAEGLDRDFIEFGRQSNQIQNFLMTMVDLDTDLKIQRAVGFYIELLPNHLEQDIDYLEEKFANNQLRHQLLTEKNYDTFLKILVPDAVKIGENKIAFGCTCTQDKIVDAFRLFKEDEIKEMITEGKPVAATCDFCKKNYTIEVSTLRELLA